MSEDQNHWTASVEKVSLIVTLLLGLTGWCIVQIVDRTVNAPIVEVTKTERRDADLVNCADHQGADTSYDQILEYKIRNISNTSLLRGIRFLVEPDDVKKGGIVGVGLEAEPPASALSGDVSCQAGTANFDVPELHPGNIFRLRVGTVGRRDLELRIIRSASPLKLQNSGLQTWLVRKEMLVLLSVAMLGTVAALVLIVALVRG